MKIEHAADIAYITENFMKVDALDPNRPAPSYVLTDGRFYVPRDYYDQEIDRERFIERYCAAARVLELEASLECAHQEWEAFMSGIYGVCLRSATPENIARKSAAIRDIDLLLESPNPSDAQWRRRLTEAVDRLDELGMPFSPVFDRARFGRPPSRDTYIRDVREKYGLPDRGVH